MSDVSKIPDDVLRAMHASSRDPYAYFDGPPPAPTPGAPTYTRPDRLALAEEVLALRACLRENIEDAGLVNGRARIIERCQALLPANPVERKA